MTQDQARRLSNQGGSCLRAFIGEDFSFKVATKRASGEVRGPSCSRDSDPDLGFRMREKVPKKMGNFIKKPGRRRYC